MLRRCKGGFWWLKLLRHMDAMFCEGLAAEGRNWGNGGGGGQERVVWHCMLQRPPGFGANWCVAGR